MDDPMAGGKPVSEPILAADITSRADTFDSPEREVGRRRRGLSERTLFGGNPR
jgi:hypothetical protein